MRTAIVLGVLLCMTVAIGGVSARADCEGAGTVTASALNMRSEPNTSSSVITTAPRGAVVLVTGSSNGWYQVMYDGRSGYMSGDYLTFSTSAQADFGTGTISGTGVNVRSGPSTNDTVVASVNSGVTMAVTGVSGAWYQVSYNGATAYVNGSYLTLSGTGTTQAAPAGSSATTGAGTTTSSASGTGTINGDYVRLRSGPSTGYSVLGTYNKGATMTVTGVSGDWYAVTANGVSGYVYKQYLTVQSGAGGSTVSVTEMNTAGTTTAAVNLRSGPSTAYTSLGVLPVGTSVTVTGKADNWYKVSYNGAAGYIRSDYVSTGTSAAPAGSGSTGTTTTETGSTTGGEKIVAEAKKYQGVRYVYGGTSPSGFDCSGFVYYVYKQCGYSITRTATAQSYLGTSVARANLQPGDIIIFYNGYKSAIGHAGIYIGNNQFIHASSGGGKVMISSLSESYYNTRFHSARRVAK